ncbi:MAG: 2-oxoisovalerate dehydrogenase subunit beta [Candidatus Sericytochromatia bacterium]|nr:MAG: 2-oxoisovalerate dehydrogenase subunit beta [Candidatus Sericytochromatia bacterium]
MAQLTLLQAINQALKEEMRRDNKVIILGEDVGLNGGVFRATEGLFQEFGEERVIDTPLAESGIIGMAIGMAMYGLRPIPEIQFMDFIYPAFEQIVNEMAKMRYRSGGQYNVPLVLRTPYGGGIRGGHYHSQSSEAYFTHTPGLKVVVPSNPYDAKGLLISSIRDNDPVLFLEPKKLYRTIKGEVPENEYIIPLGKASIPLQGDDVTVIAYGAMIPICISAAKKANEEGISTEVIDLRTLIPLDKETILNSVKKTGKVVIVYEAPKTGGFGSELSAIIAEEAIEYLEAPILRIAGLDTPYPYTLEHIYSPDPRRVYEAIKKVYNF